MQKDSIELINIMTLFFKKTFYILKLEKMSEKTIKTIIVKTQTDLDKIKLDFVGRIEIQ
jgi:hypothetical protein